MCPDRRKNIQNSTKNRRKVALGQLGATKVDSGASREAPGTASEREKIASGSFLGARGRLQDRPGGIRRASGGLLGRSCDDFGCCRDASILGTVRCRNASRIDFSSFSSHRTKAPRCFAYHVLQCFVALGRRKPRTGGKGAEARKSTVFSLQN